MPVSSADDLELATHVARYYADPLGFVMFAFDWKNDTNLHVVKLQEPWSLVYDSEYGPEAWFCEMCDEIGALVRANKFDALHPSPVDPIRFSRVSGHGIAKSAGVAMLVQWIMATRPFAKGTVTASTMPQLESKTWAEIAKWNRRAITGHWFRITTGKGAMRMVHKDYAESWACAAQASQKENEISFQGQHAVNSTSFFFFDEASGVADECKESAEGGLSDGEPMMFAFGNGNKNHGWFYDTQLGLAAKRWNHKSIDSREVQITNKKLIAQQIEDYGVDSDFCKVRIRGMFPAMGALQYFSTTDVDAAFGRHLRIEQYGSMPKILTLDNAWEGDDPLVIGMRQGLKYEILRKVPKNDNDVEVANMLANLEDEHKCDAVFIDGGFGTGVYSIGKSNGRDWQLVWFGGKSPTPDCLNMRAYMLQQVRNWLKAGGSYGPNKDLQSQFTSMQMIGRVDGVLQFESKRDAKEDGRPSPNELDALGLSFAFPVVAKVKIGLAPSAGGTRNADELVHDPYAHS